MGWTVYANNFPNSSSIDMFRFKERMKTGGWMVSGSSDGTNFSASTDLLENSGSGLGGLDNARAWFRLIQPDNGREFLIQKDSITSTDRRWNVHYSSDGVGFVSGSPDATTKPTAADEVLIVSGSNTNWLMIQSIPIRSDLIIGDADEGYSFFWQQRLPGSSNVYACLGMDVVLDPHPLDPDPAVIIKSINETDFFGNHATDLFQSSRSVSTDAGSGTWFYKDTGSGNEHFGHIPLNSWAAGTSATEQMEELGANPFNGEWKELPAFWGRGNYRVPNIGMLKGTSRIFRIISLSAGKGIPNKNNTRIFMGSVSILWNSGSTFLK